ncbi:MAG: redoxin domain-containing protein [Planctomycetota bacterium]|nr:redoxin domain-containing protein [Planctomycetota bacterium]
MSSRVFSGGVVTRWAWQPVFLFIILANLPARASEADRNADLIGRKIADFVLPDTSGKQISLSDFPDAKARVVVFIGTECEISNSYAPDLIALQERFRDRGVQFLAINSLLTNTPAKIAQHAVDYKLNFPVLVDTQQVVADLFEAKRIPTAYLLDYRNTVRYVGRIDDRVTFERKAAQAEQTDLVTAIEELLAGTTVTKPHTQVDGCKITVRSRVGKAPPTFSADVAGILHQRCAGCHHADTAAPFPLLTYEDARDRADMIREVVSQLPQREIDTLLAWIDKDTPLGDPAKVPPPPQFATGWQIPQPDLVFELPEAHEIPASGIVEYKYFVVPTNLEHDVWVQASEARPENRGVVHHIIVFMRPKGSKELKKLPSIAGFAVGTEANILPPGTGVKIPAGTELVFEMHYTPNGKAGTDRSQVGFVLCKEPPAIERKGGAVANLEFSIPAGKSRHEVAASKVLEQDIELCTLLPHMHLRGRDFRYTVTYPDGRSEVLLNVPAYDFRWQHRYVLTTPKLLPTGTRIDCVAHFDNSPGNPSNPDPKVAVKWGDQSTEEMMIGFFGYVELTPLPPKPAPVKAAEAAKPAASD